MGNKVPRSAPKRRTLAQTVAEQECLSRMSLRRMLGPGWHTIAELAERLKSKIPPEVSSQVWVDSTPSVNERKRRAQTALDDQVWEGLLLLVGSAMRHLIVTGAVEAEGAERYLKYRRASWYCYNCSATVRGDRDEKKGLCEECAVAQGVS